MPTIHGAPRGRGRPPANPTPPDSAATQATAAPAGGDGGGGGGVDGMVAALAANTTPGRAPGSARANQPRPINMAKVAKDANDLLPKSSDIEIPEFSGKNENFWAFYSWTVKVTQALEVYGMAEVLTTKPEDVEEPEEPVRADFTLDAVGRELYNEEYHQYLVNQRVIDMRDRLIESMFRSKLSGPAALVIQSTKGTYNCWSALMNHFLPAKKAHEIKVTDWWKSLSMGEGQDASTYNAEFMKRMELVAYYRKRDCDGAMLNNNDVVFQYISSLTDEFLEVKNSYFRESSSVGGGLNDLSHYMDLAISIDSILSVNRKRKFTGSRGDQKSKQPTTAKSPVERDEKTRSVKTVDSSTSAPPQKKKKTKVEKKAAAEAARHADASEEKQEGEQSARNEARVEILSEHPHVRCYNCGKKGHYSTACDQPRKKKEKAAMVRSTPRVSHRLVRAEMRADPRYANLSTDEFERAAYIEIARRESDLHFNRVRTVIATVTPNDYVGPEYREIDPMRAPGILTGPDGRTWRRVRRSDPPSVTYTLEPIQVDPVVSGTSSTERSDDDEDNDVPELVSVGPGAASAIHIIENASSDPPMTWGPISASSENLMMMRHFGINYLVTRGQPNEAAGGDDDDVIEYVDDNVRIARK